MKKIMCPSCDKVVDATDFNDKLYCPHCFKNISVEQGRKHLDSFIFKHLNLGRKMLNEASEYKKARENFMLVLEVIDDDVEASEGLVLSTLLMSTVRTSFVKEANEELIRYKNVLKAHKYTIDRTADFVDKLNSYLDEYVLTLEKRLSDGNRFYETKGKELYFKALDDVIHFKKTILNLYFEERKLSLSGSLNEEKLKKDIANLSKKRKAYYYIETSPLHLLDTDVKECYISDQIFKDVRRYYKLTNRLLITSLISSFFFVLGIILIFALPKKLIIGVTFAGIFGLLTIVLFIIEVIYQKKLTQ